MTRKIYTIANNNICKIKLCKFLLSLLTVGFCSIEVHALDLSERWSGLGKEDKLKYTNAGIATAVTLWGIANWDYFQSSPHAVSEGWFGADTQNGGADKLGHMYGGYVLGRGLSSLYESWGYNHEKAARYGVWSSFGLLGLVEAGDSFSGQYGFSYEDFIANAMGSYFGYLTETRPNLASKIDFRIEYVPSNDQGIDLFTDYEHSKYLFALKLEGFKSVRNKYLKYLEIHAGYYTRGYDDLNSRNERNFYFGIGFNFSRLSGRRGYRKTATFLNYYQLPKTTFVAFERQRESWDFR